jgi:hypothetical protein
MIVTSIPMGVTMMSLAWEAEKNKKWFFRQESFFFKLLHPVIDWTQSLTRNPNGSHDSGSVRNAGAFFFFPPFFPFFGIMANTVNQGGTKGQKLETEIQMQSDFAWLCAKNIPALRQCKEMVPRRPRCRGSSGENFKNPAENGPPLVSGHGQELGLYSQHRAPACSPAVGLLLPPLLFFNWLWISQLTQARADFYLFSRVRRMHNPSRRSTSARKWSVFSARASSPRFDRQVGLRKDCEASWCCCVVHEDTDLRHE